MKRYKETRPAAAETKVTCKECGEEVVIMTYTPSHDDFGACACAWTTWCRDAKGQFWRSTPLGYEPRQPQRPKRTKKPKQSKDDDPPTSMGSSHWTEGLGPGHAEDDRTTMGKDWPK